MIKLVDAYKTYDNGTKALNGVNLEIADGEFAFIVGPSGSGKSTMMKLLIGEIRPTSGKVYVNDFDLTTIKNRQLPYMRRTCEAVCTLILLFFPFCGAKSAKGENVFFKFPVKASADQF